MDNGHVDPSDYALRFGSQDPNPNGSHKAHVDDLRRRASGEWPHLLGTLFAHREASMLAALGAIVERAGGCLTSS